MGASHFMPWSNQSGGGDKNAAAGRGSLPAMAADHGGRGRRARATGVRAARRRTLRKFCGAARTGCVRRCRAAAVRTRCFFGLIGLGAVALWLMQAVYTVQPDEQAVELRFGKPKTEISGPGLHFHFWPVETFEKIQTSEKQVNVGSDASRGTGTGLMLSGDQNIVDVRFSVLLSGRGPRLLSVQSGRS